MSFVKFPSIGVYGTAIRELIARLRYDGKDEDGNVIFNRQKILPTVNFKGTVKIHGSNAGVCLDVDEGDIFAQSRKRILTVQDDNYGFACFVEKNKDIFKEIFDIFIKTYDIHDSTISLYFEWCGKGITKGVGVSQLDKMAVMFDMAKVNPHYNRNPYWIETNIIMR